MEELRPEQVATEEPKAEGAGGGPRGPVEIVRPGQRASTGQKTVGVLKAILPLAMKILPLLDGQYGTVVSNLVGVQTTPRHVAQTVLPLQEGIAQLEKQHIELRAQVAGQTTALKQIDEQIESVRKLTVQTAEEQQNLTARMEGMNRKMNVVALVGLVVLAALIAVNVVVYVHIRRAIP